jgi:hypothetical protein
MFISVKSVVAVPMQASNSALSSASEVGMQRRNS